VNYLAKIINPKATKTRSMNNLAKKNSTTSNATKSKKN
jgi:hypothetical protein